MFLSRGRPVEVSVYIFGEAFLFLTLTTVGTRALRIKKLIYMYKSIVK